MGRSHTIKRLFILAICLFPVLAFSDAGFMGEIRGVSDNQYYVDATSGSNSNTGLRPGQAWQTISKVNGETFNPGDRILFKKGEIWREQLTVPSSGSAGNPITFAAYGSGDDPVINAADEYNDNDWTSNSTSGTFYPDESTDDAWVIGASGYQDALTRMEMGANATNPNSLGVRFINVTVPKDATIISSTVTFTAYGSNSETTCNIDIYGEDNDEPAVFSTYADYWARTETTAKVDWTVGAWTEDSTTNATSPDISSIVSEITALTNWTSGDDIVIMFQNDSSDASAIRRPYSYDNGSDIPQLDITYGTANVWYMDSPMGDVAGIMVVVDGTIASQESTKGGLSSEYEYFVDTSESPDIIYLYSTDDPDNHTVEVSTRTDAIYVNAEQYINIQDITVKYASYAGVRLINAQAAGNVTIDGVTAIGNRVYGFVAQDGHDLNTFENCTATSNGIGFGTDDADSITLRNNTAYNTIKYTVSPLSDGSGIGLYKCSDCLVTLNKSYNNPDGCGIEYDGADADGTVTISYNWLYGNGSNSEGYALNIDNQTGETSDNLVIGNLAHDNGNYEAEYNYLIRGPVELYNNVAYADSDFNTTQHYNLVDGAVVMKNNIGYITSGSTQRQVRKQAGVTSLTSDNNLFYSASAESDQFYYEGGAETLAEWQVHGYDISSIDSDPQFTDGVNNDFTLQAASPAIDAGADLGTGADYQVFADGSALPPNTPTLVDQDSDDPPWDIGAFGGYTAVSYDMDESFETGEDDFDEGTGTPGWTITDTDGAISTYDTNYASDGTHSFSLVLDSDNSNDNNIRYNFGSEDTDFYFSFEYKVPDTASNDAYYVWIGQNSGSTTKFYVQNNNVGGSSYRANIRSQSAASTNYFELTPGNAYRYEIHFKGDSGSSTMKIYDITGEAYLDCDAGGGDKDIDVAASDDGLQYLKSGDSSYSDSTAVTAYLDDLKVDLDGADYIAE